MMHSIVHANEPTKRATFLLRPFLLKRHVKGILPETGLNLHSGYKVEDHQHAMESYHVLVFHICFVVDTEKVLLKCLLSTTLQVNHFNRLFFSSAKFFSQGGVQDNCYQRRLPGEA